VFDDKLTWVGLDTDEPNGLDFGVVTVAQVRYAKEGEAEGGLGALVRFMTGALHPEVKLPALSPAGWYWQATIKERGDWSRPAGPFVSPALAVEAADAGWATRTWGRGL